ncbi:HlyD family efflux transporter periplasmic adaptor subunit [Desulfotruncus alcoholivorax]|uniref:HlyD family efflux transporter periplasmic adaptor subunit n=1 Tax=Desulfotruncus alcoholivorax TaxID=265477 RepID=UPI0003FB6576|nr:HlyD family efflux transporter periplasmic adaptor subunit [Desulfotruncus alcoholivorax]
MGKYKLHPGRFILVLAMLVGILTVAVWGVFSTLGFAKGAIVARMLDVQQLTWQESIKSVPVEGTIIRREETIKAPSSGKLQLLARDGDRLRVGAPVARINGVSKETIISPGAGIFCTHLDGLENLLDPGMTDVLDMEAVEKISNSSGDDGSEEVSGGTLIGKVVDNLNPIVIYLRVDLAGDASGELFKKGLKVTLSQGKQVIRGNIIRLWNEKNSYTMFIQVDDNYPESFVHGRRQKMDLALERLEGWLVPEGAIVFKDGNPGLYLVEKQTVTFAPVTVEGRLNGLVSVRGKRLSNTVRYVVNPDWASEGSRLGS